MAVGRLPEPSWHRRMRRERSGQRLLTQVSAACAKLAEHHGSEPPAILRPLLNALSKCAPRPGDVPWPAALIQLGSHRSPKTMIMPIPVNEILETNVDPMAASTSPSLVQNFSSGVFDAVPSSTSSTIEIQEVAVASVVASSSSTLAGDFRSLPCSSWRSIQYAVRTASGLRSAGFLVALSPIVDDLSTELSVFWASVPIVTQDAPSSSRLYVSLCLYLEQFKNDLPVSSQGWSTLECASEHFRIFAREYANFAAGLRTSVLAELPVNSNLRL
jgi:hypothetical protein